MGTGIILLEKIGIYELKNVSTGGRKETRERRLFVWFVSFVV